uniref:Ig-like domain-containing protein n=1 Tax=Cyprinus carpio TaxID=7962 RepID=A0A8C1S0V1_CYPCA
MDLIITLFLSAVSGNVITPDETELFAEEGSNVTLSCSYSSADYLYWYRQYPGSFLLLVDEYSTKSEPDLRLYSKATKQIKRVDLLISSAAVSDSALYYCALQPTVTGNTRTLYKNLIHSIASGLHKCVS